MSDHTFVSVGSESIAENVSDTPSSQPAEAESSAPVAQRPSLARKRRVGNSSLPSMTFESRVPSSLSLSSEDTDDDLSHDSFKKFRSNVDSDEALERVSLQSASEFPSSCSESESSGNGPRLVGGLRKGFPKRMQHLQNGEVIGDFKIFGAGPVTKAVHSITSKVFDCQVLQDAEALAVARVVCRLDDAKRFYRGRDLDELRDMVQHPDAEMIEETSGRMLLFTPIAPNGSLHDYAEKKGALMSEADVAPLFEQVVRLLSFCHSLGIIIRDFKPRKLVFDGEMQLRLANVLECVVCDNPNNDMIKDKYGSPAYVPPEVLCCKSEYSGKAADMWGLGVLLYLLLLGRYPFFDHTPVGVFQRIKKARVQFPPECNISKNARALVYGLLRRDPYERPTSTEMQYIQWIHPSESPCRNRAGTPENPTTDSNPMFAGLAPELVSIFNDRLTAMVASAQTSEYRIFGGERPRPRHVEASQISYDHIPLGPGNGPGPRLIRRVTRPTRRLLHEVIAVPVPVWNPPTPASTACKSSTVATH